MQTLPMATATLITTTMMTTITATLRAQGRMMRSLQLLLESALSILRQVPLRRLLRILKVLKSELQLQPILMHLQVTRRVKTAVGNSHSFPLAVLGTPLTAAEASDEP